MDHQDAAPAAPNGNGHAVLETSGEIGKLAEALALAQAEIEGATKDAANPFFNSKYADLASVWGACRVALTKHGIAVVQAPAAHENEVSVATTVMHGSGQWMRSTLTLLAKDASPQAIGSAVTYARRYGLSAMVGVAPEDDDGNAAQGTSAPSKPLKPWQRGPAPKSNAPAELIGQPRPAEVDPASDKAAKVLFPTAAEEAERASYIKELKRLKTKLKLSDDKTTEYGNTYLGAGVSVATADLPDLALLVDFLRKTAGEPKYGAEGVA